MIYIPVVTEKCLQILKFQRKLKIHKRTHKN